MFKVNIDSSESCISQHSLINIYFFSLKVYNSKSGNIFSVRGKIPQWVNSWLFTTSH